MSSSSAQRLSFTPSPEAAQTSLMTKENEIICNPNPIYE